MNSSNISIELVNEGDNNKLYGKIERNDFTDEEKEIFAKLQIPQESLDKLKHEFIIDMGLHGIGEEKENTSLNNGSLASIYLRATGSEIVVIKKYKLEYSITGTIVRNSNLFKGAIHIKISYDENVDGKYVPKLEFVTIPFNDIS